MIPNPKEQQDITELIQAWKKGDPNAGDALFEILYPALRKISGKIRAREGNDLSLETSDLLQETYLRLAAQKNTHWTDRGHFYAVSARIVRRIIVDHARHRNRLKRGRTFIRVPFAAATEKGINFNDDWLALDEALRLFEGTNPVAAKVVELRYFAGLNNEEIAKVLDIGVATVGRHWRFARAWLKSVLDPKQSGQPETPSSA